MSATQQAEHLPADTTSPLAETVKRINALNTYRTYRMGIPDDTEGWVRLSRFADAGMLSTWFEALVGHLDDRHAAAVALGRTVVSTVVLPWAFPVLVESRFPLGSADDTAVHRHAQGWIDAVAYGYERVAVLPDDPAAGWSDVEVVPDREALLDALAEKLVEVEPFFAALRSVYRLGWAVLWGELADQVGTAALWLARLMNRNRWAAWRDAEMIFDRLQIRQAQARVRPRVFPVAWSGGEELFAVRGTCCLNYRTVKEPTPEGKEYCTTCPLRSDTWRMPLLQEQLEGKPAT